MPNFVAGDVAMDSDLIKLIITLIGATVTAAGLVVQLRKLLPEWQNERGRQRTN
jgi:hypothetical protein